MSNIYYPESWMQHPEVLRLQQRVRELERKIEEIQDAEMEKVEYWKRIFGDTNSDLREYIHRATSAEAKYKGAQEEIQKLEQQMEAFNQLSFIRKATFHFRID